MKYPMLVIALSLGLFGCGHRDTRLQKEVVGSWKRDDHFEMSLSPDGSFVSHWTTTNKSLTYEGTWKIQSGSVVSTITNCTADGYTNFEPVGSVDHFKIIMLDKHRLVYQTEEETKKQTISLSR